MNTIECAYKRFCRKRFPLPNEQQVADLERHLAIILPDDYRHFLLEFNGGYFTEPSIAPPVEGCPVDGLTYMHGFGASHRSAEIGNERQIAIFKEDVDDPVEVLPIGYTLMGNFILLVTKGKAKDKIILRTFEESFFLADDIESFFGLLCEAP